MIRGPALPPPLVVMMTTSLDSFTSLQKSIGAAHLNCQVKRVSEVAAAGARIAGGGVAALVWDASSIPEIGPLPLGVPLLIWCQPHEVEGLQSIHGSTTQVVTADSVADELRKVLAQREVQATAAPSTARCPVIAVMGVKGGVGTTTAAINISAALTSNRRNVVLSEIRPTLGTLRHYFQPGLRTRGLTEALTNTNISAASLLWPSPYVAGLNLLFGPISADDCHQIDPSRAVDLIHDLAANADYLVLDLPNSMSSANRSILGACTHLVLVLDRYPVSIGLGQSLLRGMQGWERTPASCGSIVVMRSPEGPQVVIQEISSKLGVPLLKVIPPAADACFQSELKHMPLVLHDPESLASTSYLELAATFRRR